MSRTAVAFDAYGTLIKMSEPVGETYRRVALEFGVDLPAWRLEESYPRALSQMPPSGLDGETSEARRAGERRWWRDVIRRTFQIADSTATFADFDGFAEQLFETYRSAERWQALPGARDLLEGCRQQGLRTAIASNFDHRLPGILQDLGMSSFFDTIILPHEVGHRKPAVAYFEALAARLGCGLRELIYVGDEPEGTLVEMDPLGLHTLSVQAADDLAAIGERVFRLATVR